MTLRNHNESGALGVLWIVCALIEGGLIVSGQEMLRNQFPTANAESSRHYSVPAAGQPEEKHLFFTVGLNTTYSDNLKLQPKNGIGDVSFGPRLGVSSHFLIGQQNSLSLSLDGTYLAYLGHSELNRFSLSPRSAINLNIFAGPVIITIQDAVSYSVDPIDVGSVSGVGTYGGLNNTASVSASLPVQNGSLTAGYSRQNFFSTTAASDAQERATDMVFANAMWNLSSKMSIGPEGSFAWTAFSNPTRLNSDSVNYSIGANSRFSLSEDFSLTARGGYTIYQFESGSTFFSGKSTPGFYADVGIQHRLNRILQYRLFGGHVLQTGINSDTLTTLNSGVSISLSLIRNVTTSLNFRYEKSSDARSTFAESFSRYIGGVSFDFRVVRNVNLTLNYSAISKLSDHQLRDYMQNVVSLLVSMRF